MLRKSLIGLATATMTYSFFIIDASDVDPLNKGNQEKKATTVTALSSELAVTTENVAAVADNGDAGTTEMAPSNAGTAPAVARATSAVETSSETSAS